MRKQNGNAEWVEVKFALVSHAAFGFQTMFKSSDGSGFFGGFHQCDLLPGHVFFQSALGNNPAASG